jgi:hypothetical protein
MPNSRCSYSSFSVKLLAMPGLHHPLRIPIYKCVVADTMRTRLRFLPDGEALASSLEQTAMDGTSHSIYGPDMEPLSPINCTDVRCQRSCLPAFADLMTDLGLDPTLPSVEQGHS